jgi:hypothetical protein
MKLIRPCALFALTLSACASLDAHFETMLPPDFPPEKGTIALLGVFSEGHLDPAYWSRIAPEMATAFSTPACDALYDKQLHEKDGDLFDTLSARARDEGVSNELIQTIEARTDAPLIGFVYVEPPTKVARPQRRADSRLPVPPPGGRRGRRGMIAQRGAQPEAEDTALTMTFYVYSRAARDTVAQLSMRYTGQRPDDAPRMFLNRVATTFGELKCVGWR